MSLQNLSPTDPPREPVLPALAGGAARSGPDGVVELTDIDGDALTVTADGRGIWITCTADREEVTVGPFGHGTLGQALRTVA